MATAHCGSEHIACELSEHLACELQTSCNPPWVSCSFCAMPCCVLLLKLSMHMLQCGFVPKLTHSSSQQAVLAHRQCLTSPQTVGSWGVLPTLRHRPNVCYFRQPGMWCCAASSGAISTGYPNADICNQVHVPQFPAFLASGCLPCQLH